MLKDLKFVASGIARKDFVQALQHFRIENRTIKAFNGMMGLSCPIDLDLDVTPKADSFIKAIQTCKDTIALHVTSKGKLSIKSGNFKAMIECIPKETYPEINPEGDFIDLTMPILSTIKKLAPFISEDASRPWSRGVLFKGQSAYATNNIILLEAWLGVNFPVTVNIPRDAINELIRINEEPLKMQVSANRITFHFEGDRWLSCQTFSTEWPNLSKLLDKDCMPEKFPEGLFDAIEDLSPFVDELERIWMNAGIVKTSFDDESAASVELESIKHECCFNHKHFLSLKPIAETIDLSTHPMPCLFFGDKIRGAIVGMKIHAS